MQQNEPPLATILPGEFDIEILLSKYGNYLHVLARMQVDRYLQSKIDAADLVQEAAMLAVRDFGQFRGSTETEFLAWLCTLLGNVCAATIRRYFKTQSRDLLHEQRLQEMIDRSSAGLSRLCAEGRTPSQSAARRETAVLVANALQSLPSDCREVLTRKYLHDQAIVDIGRDLGKSRHAISRLLAKATVQFREAMERVDE